MPSWPDFALFVAAVAFCAFSAKAFTRAPVSSPATIPSKVSRGLASVSQEQPTPERTTRTLSFSCQEEKNVRAKTDASLLRLTAEGCSQQILRVTNQSTGESLMLFERGGKFSTHYFPLKEGDNKVVIEWKDARRSAKMIELEKN